MSWYPKTYGHELKVALSFEDSTDDEELECQYPVFRELLVLNSLAQVSPDRIDAGSSYPSHPEVQDQWQQPGDQAARFFVSSMIDLL